MGGREPGRALGDVLIALADRVLRSGWCPRREEHRRQSRADAPDDRPTILLGEHGLVPDEEAEVEIELVPSTGLLRKGQRIRVDVRPCDRVAHGMHHADDPAYHGGAVNRVHTGRSRLGYVRLPIVG